MPMIGAAAAGIGGGLLSSSASKKAANRAADAMKAALAAAQKIIDEVGAPPDQSAPIILEQLRQAGVLTPELEAQVTAQPTAFQNIQEDTGLRDRQVKALSELSKRGRAGLTPEERAEFNKSRQEVQRDLQGKNEQIINDMAMRGQAGGGAEIAARMLATQEGADRASEEADRIQAAASQRALQAIMMESDAAGNIRGQDFQVASAKANAADEMNRFNTTNQIAINQRNVGTQNVAQEANLGNKQRIQDTNTSTKNAETYAQKERERQFWNDKLAYAQARTAPILGMGQVNAQQAQQVGQANANMWSNIGGGAAAGFGALSNYYAKQPSGGTPKNLSTTAASKDDTDAYNNMYTA